MSEPARQLQQVGEATRAMRGVADQALEWVRVSEERVGAAEKRADEVKGQVRERALLTLRKVTLPLVLPAVSTGALLTFVLSIADFGTPSIVGGRVRAAEQAEAPPRLGERVVFVLLQPFPCFGQSLRNAPQSF